MMTLRRLCVPCVVVLATALGCVSTARAAIETFVDYRYEWSGGSWTKHKDSLGYGTPTWQSNHLDLTVPNIAVPDWCKEVWVEVEWASGRPGSAPGLNLTQPGAGVRRLVTAPETTGYTWHWHLTPQPAEEWLRFPDTSYFDLQNISSIEIGTYCATKTIHKPKSLYGNLDQHKVPVIGDDACGPTSVVNSFVYLEQAYPDIYDRKLVPDTDGQKDYDESELISVAQTLAGPPADFDGWKGWELINAKKEYINGVAAGSTIFGAQYDWPWPAEAGARPPWVKLETPTWQWLYDQLVACEDIEIKLDRDSGDPGHWLTLTSFEWLDLDDDTHLDREEPYTDTNGNGEWDPGEPYTDTNGNGQWDSCEAKIDYIDPDDGLWHECNAWLDGGKLRTDYWAAGNWIGAAVKESPIPEPSTLIVWSVLGGLGITYGWRRRRRAPA